MSEQLKFKEHIEPEAVGWCIWWTVVELPSGDYTIRPVMAYSVRGGYVVRVGCFRIFVSIGTLHSTEAAAETRASVLNCFVKARRSR